MHPFVHANILAAIAALAQGLQGSFAPHYAPVMQYLRSVLGRQPQSTPERLWRSRGMLCVAHVASAVGMDTFRPDAEAVVEAVLASRISDGDPQMSTLHEIMPLFANVMGVWRPFEVRRVTTEGVAQQSLEGLSAWQL